ncbi:MAG: Gfo/Idh/MocA family oxidoreductase [Candidatus Devosia phytovorans]|uniref:Gfo/Idh/MocA family oxidoreductase n=1 Tax=Candidatus Devosia phytovorans TaxID=3121372 RepID=A0AAJ5VU35_9HYPH|nr:Gfo/Idh/MocA family oxidoreductase [Devosia sp.]WEK04362.1 MAG: Gfo/Idh/MocA family oxidoreductase [Devosia sp.]
MDAGIVTADEVQFPNWRLAADGPAPTVPTPTRPEERIGFAVMGLGRLALGQILPALVKSKRARLVGLISGHPEKCALVGHQYGVELQLNYDQVGALSDRPDVGAVFIATPNGLHLQHVQDVVRAGKAILLEKPMAANSMQAIQIERICREAGVPLMIGYRSQFEPHLGAIRDGIRTGTWGRLKAMTSVNVQTAAPGDHWRYDKARAGGGSLPDIGIYCISVAQYLSGERPTSVGAVIHQPQNDPRFDEVEESCALTLEFPSGFVLQSFSSYGAREEKFFKLMFEKATITVTNAYAYGGVAMTISRSDGQGISDEALELGAIDQFEAEIDHFAQCLQTGTRPRTGPDQGIRDHKIMEAAYRAAAERRILAIDLDA